MHLSRGFRRRVTLVLMLTPIAAGGQAVARPAPPSPPPPHQGAANAAHTASDSVILLSNAARRQHKLPELTRNTALTRAAQLQADQMAASRTLAHAIPTARYRRLQDRLEAVGYHWRATSENVGSAFPNAADLVSSWMNSHGHRATLLSPSFAETGAGVASDSHGVRYWVQVYGMPR